MSGICGIVSLNGRPIAPRIIDDILESLRVRGPESAESSRDDLATFGHTLLATTPEAASERLPLVHAQTGCTITADIRLDNRADLFESLRLSGQGRVIGDGELVLLAYLTWGKDCVNRLLGDFAFAIWDPRNRKTFCARDAVGMRQFIYCYHPRQLFVFATDVSSVLAHPEVNSDLNGARIIDYLADLEGYDRSSTFYREVRRLPAGHSMIVDAHALKIQSYWAPSAQPELRLKSDDQYNEAFLEVFRAAVSCRLRTNGPVGLLLSGGVDSAAIAAVSSELLKDVPGQRLSAFSVVDSAETNCPETANILRLSGYPGIDPYYFDLSEPGLNTDLLVKLLDRIEEPFDGHMNLPRAAYQVASRQNQMKVMLDGVSADVVLAAGNTVAHYLGQGNIYRAIAEAKAENEFWGRSNWHWLGAVVRSARRAWVPQFVRDYLSVFRDFASSRGPAFATIHPDLAKAHELSKRQRLYHQHWTARSTDLSMQRLNILSHPHEVAARERYDRVASRFAIEPRAPFLDVRMINFSLSLPIEQLQRQGWPKHILRRAMVGRLPEEIIWKKGKHHLGGRLTRVLLSEGSETVLAAEDASQRVLERFLSRGSLSELAKPCARQKELDDLLVFTYLVRWLRSRDKRV